MFICEQAFDDEDPQNKGYSMDELDYYGWIPFNMRTEGKKDHRLSLRKNLETGKFEIIRYFYETKSTEVAFAGSFAEALEFGTAEAVRFHGPRDKDEICQHKWPAKSVLCRVA